MLAPGPFTSTVRACFFVVSLSVFKLQRGLKRMRGSNTFFTNSTGKVKSGYDNSAPGLDIIVERIAAYSPGSSNFASIAI